MDAMAKILIVDDEPMTVEMLQTFLQIIGYQTIGVYSGEDGVLMASLEHPDAVLLDLMLPDVEGFEVCRRLRTLPTFPEASHVPIIIISARTDAEAVRRALEFGANHFMTKPIKFPELTAMLEQFMANRGPKPAAD